MLWPTHALPASSSRSWWLATAVLCVAGCSSSPTPAAPGPELTDPARAGRFSQPTVWHCADPGGQQWAEPFSMPDAPTSGDVFDSGGRIPADAEAYRWASEGARTCHERALEKQASTEGRLSFRMAVNPQGRVGAVCIASTPGLRQEAALCVAGTLKQLQFAPPDDGEVVVFGSFGLVIGGPANPAGSQAHQGNQRAR